MIKNIVFDIGRVLLGFEWDDYMKTLEGDEATREAVSKATFKSGFWDELDKGILETEEILNMFVSANPVYEKEIRNALARVGECTTRCDYAIPWIESLKARGYNVYYLSNYSDYVKSQSAHALDFIPHMDGGVFSYIVRSIKPDKGIYEELFSQYGLNPDECIFIDDKKANIEAGEALGMRGIVFENYQQAAAELDRMLEC